MYTAKYSKSKNKSVELSVDLICVGGLNVSCRESGTHVPYSEDPGLTSRLRHRLSELGLHTIFDVITSFSAGYIVGVGRVRTVIRAVLYDVTAWCPV